jgi:hypothetical protein
LLFYCRLHDCLCCFRKERKKEGLQHQHYVLSGGVTM